MLVCAGSAVWPARPPRRAERSGPCGYASWAPPRRNGFGAYAAASPLATALETLGAYGFSPRAEGDGYALGNCPFHALSAGWLDSHSGFPRYPDAHSARGCYPGISAKPWATAHGAHSGTSTSPSRPTGSLRVITARWSHTPRSLG
jgi:hypothetical protein